MKNRIFVMLLCCALLIGMLPATALAINHISMVELSVAVPQHGATPEKPSTTNDRVSVYAYEWYQDGNRLYYGETFEGGKTYTLKTRLSTLDEFMQSASVKVNGRAAEVLSVDNNNTGLLFEIDFYVTPLGYKLSFDPGYGSGTMAPLVGKNSYILPECTFTPPAGKEFRYWQIENVTGEYRPGENIILTKDTTVRAIWGTPSGKTRIYDVEATSNISSIAVLYGNLRTPEIVVTKGAPASVLVSASNLIWQKKVNDTWETQTVGRFTAGEWRVQSQVRIDRDAATTHELGNPTTLKVDGVQWITGNNGVPSVHNDYSMIIVYSPSILIKDNPNIQPPKDVTKVALTVTGYKLGANTQHAKVISNHEGVIVASAEFAALIDSNNDGIPDNVMVTERFEAGKQYAVSFTLKAKAGYDISTLGMTGVTCNNLEAIGSYNADEDCYSGIGGLPPFDTCTVSFSAGGGKGKMSDVTVEKGDYTLPQNEFTAPEGKMFKAWSANGKELAPGSKIELTANTTITAIWDDIPNDHICTLESIEKVEPTCTEDGKEAYFRCEVCGKFFEDDEGKNAIEELFAWGNLEKLGHADEDRDGKCDVCEFVLTEAAPPDDSDTSTDAEASTDVTNSEDTEETTVENSSSSSDKNSMLWLWIALLLVLISGAAAAIVIVKKRASAK